MKIPRNKVASTLINSHISIIYKSIIPAILIFVLVSFILGFRMRNKASINNQEGWVNYMNLPFGEVKTGVDCPVSFYERPEYRLPYRWPIGIKTENPVNHVAPLMS
jgi:Na+/H+ antiporter NhaC